MVAFAPEADVAEANVTPAAGLQPPPKGEIATPKTWDTLVQERNLNPGSLAHSLAVKHLNTPWGEVMEPFTKFDRITSQDNFSSEAVMWHYGDSIKTTYFLTVSGNKWDVVYGLRRCTPLHNNGGRLAGLRGDRVFLHGAVVQPHLYQKSQGMNTQSDLFTPQQVGTSSLDLILQLLTAEPDKTRVDPPTDEWQDVAGWPMLPIHPKLACLFMGGVDLVEGARIGAAILNIIPEDFKGDSRIFEKNIRATMTMRDEYDDSSVNGSTWTRVDIFELLELADWYYSLFAIVS